MTPFLSCTSLPEVHARLIDWLQSPVGNALLRLEQTQLEIWLPKLFGYHLLFLGLPCAIEDSLALSHIRHRIQVSQVVHTSAMTSRIQGHPEHLPIANDSIDAVVLFHALDFSPDPHQILREVERVLIPEGQILIFGFNPLSLWGGWRLFARCGGKAPWCGRFLMSYRVSDWLALLGFDRALVAGLMFRLPIQQETLLRQSEFIESFGARWWPGLGAVYLIHGIKRVSRLRPIMMRWPLPSQVLSPLVTPTNAESPHRG
ncbi:MAG: methyltransferase domain-containing protein [Pseudomonadota bacterium]